LGRTATGRPSEPLPLGKSTIPIEFKYDGGGAAKGGNVTMCLNDKKVAEGRVIRREVRTPIGAASL
jgi:hypothetical protein